MLNEIKKNVTLTAASTIDGVAAENYQATINSDKPEDMNLSSWQTDKALYKANRTECRKDAAVFEDAAYAIQDALIAAKEKSAE